MLVFVISLSIMMLSDRKIRGIIGITCFSFALIIVSTFLIFAINSIEESNTHFANVSNAVESFINQNFDGVLPSEMWEMRRERSYQGFNPRPVYSEYQIALTGEFYRKFQIWLNADEITVNTNDITRVINSGRLDLRQFVG